MGKRKVGKTVAWLARAVAMGLVAVALTCALLLIFQSIFSPFHIVTSGSMEPQIKVGDAVVLKDVGSRDIKVGDIIVFEDPEKKGQYVLNRVTAIEDTGYTRLFSTKGDNNPTADRWKIPAGEVVGGVAINLPHFGDFLDFIGKKKGFILCVVAPLVAALLIVLLLGAVEKLTKLREKRRRFNPEPTVDA